MRSVLHFDTLKHNIFLTEDKNNVTLIRNDQYARFHLRFCKYLHLWQDYTSIRNSFYFKRTTATRAKNFKFVFSHLIKCTFTFCKKDREDVRTDNCVSIAMQD